MRKHQYTLILIVVLLIGLFFRTYQLVERFGFGHDADLYSWIVKDIAVNHHFRLIGQLTSSEGIFIGPFFYYMLIPFYIFFGMDPIGSAYLTPMIGILTIVSLYFVLSKIFNRKVGIIAAFLQAVLLVTIASDRWVVPTITTKLWAIWFLYTLLLLVRGNFKVLPLLGILIGLIWHVHLALLPVLLAVPFALYFSKKMPNVKQISFGLLSVIVTSLPLILFELRHNFIQTKSLFLSFSISHGGEIGWHKFLNVLAMISKNTDALFLAPNPLPDNLKLAFTTLVLLSSFILIKNKILNKSQLALLFIWIAGVVAYFTFSSILISEYYFANLEIIFITIASLLVYTIYKSSNLGKYLMLILLFGLFIKNVYFYLTYEPYHIGYVEKKAITKFIITDSKEKNFPCVAVNYITPPGENVGFRYLFYFLDLKLNKPSVKIPVYDIVFPYEWTDSAATIKFGHMGVIPPTKVPPLEDLKQNCNAENTNLTDSMFGYVE